MLYHVYPYECCLQFESGCGFYQSSFPATKRNDRQTINASHAIVYYERFTHFKRLFSLQTQPLITYIDLHTSFDDFSNPTSSLHSYIFNLNYIIPQKVDTNWLPATYFWI